MSLFKDLFGADSDFINKLPIDINKFAYHVTPSSNLTSILSKGLTPQIGERSKLIETLPAIYFFNTINDVEHALYNWLGDVFYYEPELALLQVEIINNCSQLVEWELISYIPIPPKNIKVITNDIDNMDLTTLPDYLY